MKKLRTLAQLIIIIMIFTTIAAEMPLIVRAKELTSDKLEESQEEKDKAEKSKAALQNGLTDIKSMLEELQGAKEDLSAYVEKLDGDLFKIEQNIDAMEQMVAQKGEEIEQTEQELIIANEAQQAQYETMKKRIKFMYEKGNTSYLELLFSAKSFPEFLKRGEFIRRLSEYDRNMLEAYMAATKTVEDKKAMLEVQKENLNAAQMGLEQDKNAMKSLIADKEAEIENYNNDIRKKEDAIAAYEAEIGEQTRLIEDLEAAIIMERKRLLEENRRSITYDGGEFAWPAPEYTRISDDYGYRIHPILNVKQFHNGIDMASPSGSPILAAYDGEVVTSSYSSTMGNYIMIDHGDNLFTIYMHASSVWVSEGDMVSRGEQIGCVGSTGRSTGPHLHFTVRRDGEYIDPWEYLD